MRIVLNNSGTSLVLTVNETGWAMLQLTSHGVAHQLGADSFSVVQRCFLSALGDRPLGESRGTIRYTLVACVLNLHVHPWSIYACRIDDRRHLFFRNREEGTTIELVLPKAECERWRQLLLESGSDSFMERHSFELTAKAAAE